MPLRLKDIEKYGAPISFQSRGTAMVRTGPCSASPLHERMIPMDGRHYICSGTIFLKNGITLHANFEINTHTFDFLERDTVSVYIAKEKAWYNIDEDELFEILRIKKEDAFPYKWLPDVPLNYHKSGPYPMQRTDDNI